MSDRWREYLEQKRDDYREAIPLLEAGKIGTSASRDGRIVDTTAETIADLTANLAEIESILAGDSRP